MELASGDVNINSKEARIHTKSMYEQIRNRRTDCINVSVNSGFTLEQVTIIKNYLFKDCHELSYGYMPFEPSYDIAESWRRLSEKSGKNIKHHDIILLYHELLEIQILLQGRCTQKEAHELASKQYNYHLLSDNYYRSIGRL